MRKGNFILIKLVYAWKDYEMNVLVWLSLCWWHFYQDFVQLFSNMLATRIYEKKFPSRQWIKCKSFFLLRKENQHWQSCFATAFLWIMKRLRVTRMQVVTHFYNKSIIFESMEDYEKIINKPSAFDVKSNNENGKKIEILIRRFRAPNKVAYHRRKSIRGKCFCILSLCVKWYCQ